MHWSTIGYWILAILGSLLSGIGLDLLSDGIKTCRVARDTYQKDTALVTGAIGLGLLLVGGLLFWGAWALEHRRPPGSAAPPAKVTRAAQPTEVPAPPP